MSGPRWARSAAAAAILSTMLTLGCAGARSATPVPSPTPCVRDVSGTWYTKADGGFLATQRDFEISFNVPSADGSVSGGFALPGGFPSSAATGSYDGKTMELHTIEGPPIGFTATMEPDGKTATGKTTDNANVTLTLFSRAPQCQ